MSHEQLKAKDKVVLRMTRDGAMEENLTEGTSELITKRLQEAELVKPQAEEKAIDDPEKAHELATKRHQEMAHRFQEQQAEESDVPTVENTQPEQHYPADIPHGTASPVTSVFSESHHAPTVDTGAVIANTAASSAARRTQSVKSIDGEAVLQSAERAAAEGTGYEGDNAPTRKIQRLERKSQQAHERLDAAREKLPTHKVLKKERVFDDETGKGKTQLHFEDELKIPKGQSKLRFEADKTVRKVGDTLVSGIHGKIHEVEQENSGVEAAHKSEIAAESAVHHFSHHRQKAANKPYEKLSKLEHEAHIADTKLHYEKTQQEHPEMKKQRANMNKHYQKQSIKKEYAAARRAGTQTASTATTSTGKKFTEKASGKAKEFFSKNKKVFLWLGVGLILLVMLSAGISSCTAMFTSTGSTIIATSYLSEDEAMLGAEAQYCAKEVELQAYLDNYQRTHSYDEYHFDLDAIEHDPYVLISILSALHEGEFTLAEVQDTLDMLFDKQYILTEEVVVETRYRTETDTWTDAEGNTHTETYRVPYDYYICYVTLENFNLSHVPVYIMSEDQLSMYSAYMSVVGNREDLFPGSSYVDKYIENPPEGYEIPSAYLDDATFAALIEEAEKYLNYPYVWGGSNPSTSFDCSGFVSYVLTNSGLVNTGRLGAQGLYNICTPVSDPKPGDLVFFKGTYDTPGVSHVGIYVGDQVMLHCGDPIQYTSINTSYWRSHFYAYGRPPY
ncbi:MAG: hypothetical protein EUB_02226 [Eubacterium sp.]|uniref:C40 family peptidase n=1 Tax=Eubacterium sp. TaxID=142586 RepID=UPI00303B5996